MHSSSHHMPVWTHLGTQQRCLALGTQTIHTPGPWACCQPVRAPMAVLAKRSLGGCHTNTCHLTSNVTQFLPCSHQPCHLAWPPRRGDFVPTLLTSHPMYHTHHIHTTHMPHTIHTRYTYYMHTTHLVQQINCTYSTDLLYTYHRLISQTYHTPQTKLYTPYAIHITCDIHYIYHTTYPHNIYTNTTYHMSHIYHTPYVYALVTHPYMNHTHTTHADHIEIHIPHKDTEPHTYHISNATATTCRPCYPQTAYRYHFSYIHRTQILKRKNLNSL